MTKASDKTHKVLVVDNDPTISEIIVGKLQKSGFEAMALQNSSEIIFTAEQYSPDVIILDLMMTKLTGEDALKALKLHAKLAKIPVIVFSNKGTEDDLAYLLEAGAEKCLIKSNTSLGELVKEVEEVVA